MSDPPLHNPHDKFFKEALGRTKTAAEFFRTYLPADVTSRLDWTRLERRDGSFVDETLRERHADLLFTAPWKNKEILLYCLFEHQSAPDHWMAFRLLRYMVRVWDAQIRRKPDRKRLSPILPLVLHQSEERWRVSRQLTHRFGPLPEWAENRLSRASTEEIARWSERLLDVRDLESVFEG